MSDVPTNPLLCLDYDTIKAGAIDELLRQGELRQQAMFQASLGMDQRASVLAAAFAASAGALAAAVVSLSSTPSAAGWRESALVATGMLSVAAALCAWVCRPQLYELPGMDPVSWGTQELMQRDLGDMKLARAARIQDHIAANEEQQARNGRFLLRGMLLAAAAPIVAAAVAPTFPWWARVLAAALALVWATSRLPWFSGRRAGAPRSA